MAKKVFLGVGHGGSDPGASKYVIEKDVNLNMALACRDYLVKNGVEVKLSRTVDENDPLTEEIFECNAFKPDLAVDVHNNAGGGDGFEAFYHYKGGVSKTLAENIEAEVKKIGQNSRGCKTRVGNGGTDYYGFIRETNCPAVIVEGIFVDNANDVKIADTLAEQKAFGEAYARGILKTLGITEKKTETVKTETKTESKPVDPVGSFRVRVKIKNLNIRSGAGTNFAKRGYIPPGVYTIVETKPGKGSVKGWGKLKSGAGWISLDYVVRL